LRKLESATALKLMRSKQNYSQNNLSVVPIMQNPRIPKQVSEPQTVYERGFNAACAEEAGTMLKRSIGMSLPCMGEGEVFLIVFAKVYEMVVDVVEVQVKKNMCSDRQTKPESMR
jgi:hypothetical protein